MSNHLLLLRASTIAGVLALGLSGCAQMRPSQKIDIYQAALSGAQEVPPVATAATGQAEVHFDTTTHVIKWKVTYAGMSGPLTGAHIHGPAGPGQNAPVAVGFTGNLNVQPIQGETKLTPQQADQLTAGQYYVNLHTAANPGGEIRGQLRLRR
jgi:hypothetical protein